MSYLGQLLFVFLLLATVAGVLALWRQRKVTILYPAMRRVLFRDGVFVRELPPGRYARFDPAGRERIVQVPAAALPIALPEVTVISRDQFSFRLALSPVVAVRDARLFLESQPMIEAHPLAAFLPTPATHPALQPRLAAAAVAEIGTRTLAEVMADPAAVRAALQAALTDVLPGAAVTEVLITAINLPPETRKMFTDVERARVEAQAALERARGEQAALRVLANAARLVTDNPALANLRLLQAIETSKGPTTIVLGEGLADRVRTGGMG